MLRGSPALRWIFRAPDDRSKSRPLTRRQLRTWSLCLPFPGGGGWSSKWIVAGRLRSLPPYFGGEQGGYISEVYVDRDQRNRGIGQALPVDGMERSASVRGKG